MFPPERFDLVEEMFEKTAIDPESRSYMLTVQEIGHFCEVYNSICQREENIFTYDYRSKENAAILRRKNKFLTESLEEKILEGI